MDIRLSSTLGQLQPLVYPRLEKARLNAKAKFGSTGVIKLTIGSPDRPAPEKIRQKLSASAQDAEKYHYSLPAFGSPELLRGASDYLFRMDETRLNPKTQIVGLPGSRYAIAAAIRTMIDPGDSVLVPGFGYPAYRNGVLLAHGQVVYYSVKPTLDQFEQIYNAYYSVEPAPRVLAVCSPGNPAGQINEEDFFRKIVAFAKENDLLIISDEAYRRTCFDGLRAPGLMEFDGEEVGISTWTLSKTIDIPGPRVAFVHGNQTICAGLKKMHSMLFYGIFQAIEDAAVVGLAAEFDEFPTETAAIYQRRRDLVCNIFDAAGLNYIRPQGGMFVALEIPNRGDRSSIDVAAEVLEATGVEVVAGEMFGPDGEDYLRIALVQSDEIMEDGCLKLAAHFPESVRTRARLT